MFVMRGLPGSGKSTLSKRIATVYDTEDQKTVICSGDDYFTDPENGEYKFNAQKLQEAHTAAKNKAVQACK
jgi:uridine kinase